MSIIQIFAAIILVGLALVTLTDAWKTFNRGDK